MGVVIAGAGPTGLTLACALLQRGVPVDIVDSAAGPATTSRALGLQPRGVEVLDRIGALGDLPERGITAMNATLYTGSRPLLSFQLGRHNVEGRPLIIISQAEIEAQLRRRLGELGGHIEWGAPLVDAKVDNGAVSVTLGPGQRTVRADWLVGCDGAHSHVRKVAHIDFPGATILERFLLADVHADLPIGRDGTGAWLHRDGMFAAFPLPGEDLWRLMADVPAEGGDILTQLSRLLSTRTSMTGARIGTAVWTSAFQIQRRVASRYRRGRILLAGDAAHIHSPFGGQGLNTGIGDAENLAWKLVLVAKGIAGEQLLDTYQAERRPVAKQVVAGTTVSTRTLLGSNAAANWLRDRLILPAANWPTVQDRLLAVASQLSVSYWRGPLAPKIQIPIGLRVGDRVPDIACIRPDGTRASLHHELAGRWALVTPDGSGHPPIGRLGEEVIALKAAVPDTLLIRPDAHLGWRQRRATTELPTWLDKILGGNQVSP